MKKLGALEWACIGCAVFGLAAWMGTLVAFSLGGPDIWTALSAIGTLIGALLSTVSAGIAAWIGYKSYQASANAAKIARVALSADKAWVLVESIVMEFHNFYHNPDGDDYHHLLMITIKLKNYGSTPAMRVWFSANCIIEVAGQKYEPNKIVPLSVLPPGKEHTVHFWVHGDAGHTLMHRPSLSFLNIEVDYHDVFDAAEKRGIEAKYAILSEQDGPSSFSAWAVESGPAKIF